MKINCAKSFEWQETQVKFLWRSKSLQQKLCLDRSFREKGKVRMWSGLSLGSETQLHPGTFIFASYLFPRMIAYFFYSDQEQIYSLVKEMNDEMFPFVFKIT